MTLQTILWGVGLRSDCGSHWTPSVGVYRRLFLECTRLNGKRKSLFLKKKRKRKGSQPGLAACIKEGFPN
eukprot:1136147-Pelagomonas_calceolata.AAC.2